MKTSISDIIHAEKFLRGEMDPQEKLVFEARLALDKELRSSLFFHRMVHRLVRLYHRRKLKQAFGTMLDRMFNDPAKAHFREAVVKHFKS